MSVVLCLLVERGRCIIRCLGQMMVWHPGTTVQGASFRALRGEKVGLVLQVCLGASHVPWVRVSGLRMCSVDTSVEV